MQNPHDLTAPPPAIARTAPPDAQHARRWHNAQHARRWHDIGCDAAGPVPSGRHDYPMFEKRVDALMMMCFAKGLFTVDAMRRVLEDMAPDSFDGMRYYA